VPIQTVGVLGCGLMGSGIAHVSAAAGCRTIVREIDQRRLDDGLARIRRFLDDGVAKGKVTAGARDATLGRITGTTGVEEFAACDLVIEAVSEDLAAKTAVYQAVEPALADSAILASNTSSIGITELAMRTRRPDRFGGLHFFNPVPLMKLVEITRGLTTSEATFGALVGFARAVGKEPVIAPDQPGFIVNRLLIPYLLNAVRCLEQGLATREDIDTAMVLGCGHPMGPLALIDFIGADTTYAIANIMFDEFRDPAFAAPPLLKRMVLAGRLGRKSGEGFYKY
jgi:3-hydroxybutyryl-CoA dehydrogenase